MAKAKKTKKSSHPCRNLKQNIPGKLRVRVSRKVVEVDRKDPSEIKQPLMVAYGAGVDSTAMLILMHRNGERPDAILFADTGSEKPETIDYISKIMNPWLRSVDFPEVVVVKKNAKRYNSLWENCFANETLPSLAYGLKGCSLKWKVEPQDAWTRRWEPAYTAWAHGKKVIKCIGYDASPADSKRYAGGSDSECYEYRYPLRETDMKREDCKALIRDEGLPVPPKSACWCCPAMKTVEIEWLRRHHPELLKLAIEMEKTYQEGHNFRGHEITQEPIMDPKTGEQARYKRGPRKGELRFKQRIPIRGLFGQNGMTWTEYLENEDPAILDEMEEAVGVCPYGDDEASFADHLETLAYPV
jgi:hypothetical protein